jgi:hypothetical protein
LRDLLRCLLHNMLPLTGQIRGHWQVPLKVSSLLWRLVICGLGGQSLETRCCNLLQRLSLQSCGVGLWGGRESSLNSVRGEERSRWMQLSPNVGRDVRLDR